MAPNPARHSASTPRCATFETADSKTRTVAASITPPVVVSSDVGSSTLSSVRVTEPRTSPVTLMMGMASRSVGTKSFTAPPFFTYRRPPAELLQICVVIAAAPRGAARRGAGRVPRLARGAARRPGVGARGPCAARAGRSGRVVPGLELRPRLARPRAARRELGSFWRRDIAKRPPRTHGDAHLDEPPRRQRRRAFCGAFYERINSSGSINFARPSRRPSRRDASPSTANRAASDALVDVGSAAPRSHWTSAALSPLASAAASAARPLYDGGEHAGRRPVFHDKRVFAAATARSSTRARSSSTSRASTSRTPRSSSAS